MSPAKTRPSQTSFPARPVPHTDSLPLSSAIPLCFAPHFIASHFIVHARKTSINQCILPALRANFWIVYSQRDPKGNLSYLFAFVEQNRRRFIKGNSLRKAQYFTLKHIQKFGCWHSQHSPDANKKNDGFQQIFEMEQCCWALIWVQNRKQLIILSGKVHS